MKKITTASLGVLLFSTLVLGSQEAFASVEQPEAKSDATVQFEADNDPTDPPIVVPPTGDGKPGIVDPGGSDGSKGDGTPSFNIAYVSNFRFNDRTEDDTDFTKFNPIKLNANGMTLWAKGNQLTINEVDKDNNLLDPKVSTVYENIPNFVQVVDNRGKLSGWNLHVTASDFTGKDEEENDVVLKGAKLSLNDVSLKGPEGVLAPAIGFTNSAELSSESSLMLNAGKDAGTGSWSLKFGNEETVGATAYETLVKDTGVKLEIPASAGTKAGVNYTSKLVWTLTDAPAKDDTPAEGDE